MSYLKLAYLAEIAIVFNLAFGEWKHAEIAKELRERFNTIDQNCDGALAGTISALLYRTLSAARTTYLRQPSRTWIGHCVVWLDELRRYRSADSVDGRRYQAPIQFFQRLCLFSTRPDEFPTDNTLWGLVRKIWSVIRGIPFGFLASWAYSKTENWKYPPCRSSLVIWSLVVILCVGLTVWGSNLGTGWSVSSSGEFQHDSMTLFIMPCYPYLFIGIGIIAALLCSRPASVLVAIIVRRFPPIPRGKYYPLVMIGFVTAILMLLTLLDGLSYSAQNEVLWLFLFGFLLVAVALPIFLFVGYLALETSIVHWTEWAGSRTQDRADLAMETLSGGPK